DVVDRSGRYGADCFENLVAYFSGSGIDQQRTLDANLHGDVARPTGNHEDAALDRQHLEGIARRQRNPTRAWLRLLLAARLNHQVGRALLGVHALTEHERSNAQRAAREYERTPGYHRP